MKKKLIYALLLTASFILSVNHIIRAQEKMEWWRDARFGMFIHWGLYSIPAGEWNGKNHYGEWIREEARIPISEYDKLVNQFNPIEFNAEDWVKTAKNAGMKYIVITSKHHDGFCLFDSKFTDFDVMSTPFKRDIMKELAEACRKYEMKICWYHSIMDWHHPDYLPRRSWETDRSSEGADFKKYLDHLKNQLTELVSNYGDIGILWFDGEWEETWKHEYGVDIYNYLLSLNPKLIINNRIDVSREGMAGMSKNPDAVGDYGTPEQEIPETGLPRMDWETCMTMNNHWGYNKNDRDWKSAKDLIRNLADIASKGGNFLLNVGPMSNGKFPQESIDRLKVMGEWMKVNSESIYGTKASPFKHISWGRCTQKSTDKNTRLYLHVFDWPKNGNLSVSNLKNKVLSAWLLSDTDKKPLKFSKDGIIINISVPGNAPDSINSVVVMDIEGSPETIEIPEFVFKIKDGKIEISAKQEITDNKMKVFYTTDGTEPGKKSSPYSKPIALETPVNFKAKSYYDGKVLGETSTIELPLSTGKKVSLVRLPSGKWPADGAASLTNGQYGTIKLKGDWLGFEGNDMMATIDLGKVRNIEKITVSYMVSSPSWIFEPVKISFETSGDGEKFLTVADQKNNPENWKEVHEIKQFSKELKNCKTRYIRVIMKNRGLCPDDHQGKGNKAWIFVDEITIE